MQDKVEHRHIANITPGSC